MSELKYRRLPLVPLRGLTVFPNMILSFAVGRQKSLDAVERAMKKDETVFLVTQRDAQTAEPQFNDLYEIGTVAKVKQVLKLPGNLTHIIVEGLARGKISGFIEEDNCIYADFHEIEQDMEQKFSRETEALIRVAYDSYEEYCKINTKANSNDNAVNFVSAASPGQVADFIGAGMTIKTEEKQELLEILDPMERLNRVIRMIHEELSILKLKKKIEDKVKVNIEKSQKEYYLREQIKVIQEELGDKDGIQADMEKYQKQLEQKCLPTDAAELVKKEIGRIAKIPVASPEANVVRSYVECVLSLPWNETTKESFDLKKAEKILDEDHYGLKAVKERILEFLAVRINTEAVNAPIICLVGPPGVGKTSIAKSIAKSLNRKYVRMSLGGIRDEAEIRGHRKTYVGAMPGRIMNAMKTAGTINPLMLLDEVDKLCTSYNGDPAAALLEVLDAEQNNTFRDHYIEMPYDLSHVLFMCTANSLEQIPQALRDRMEVITLSSYTNEEKKNIAMKHLYPKQLKKNGLKKSQLKITESGFLSVIDNYTREAGVRQLERTIGELCRKAVKRIMEEEAKSITVTDKNIEKYLGPKKFSYDKIYDRPQIGIVRGLAWTSVGGDTLSIEVNTMKGSGKFELTGNMGNVMKESAKAAISFIRSKAADFNIHEDFYKDTDIHIHIPEGAVPKDGPSAGVTMATAMVSALTGHSVRNDVAMTGEITIRGRVLPIGGLKEKVIAAKRAGIQRVIIPRENEKDLKEIPENIKNSMDFVLAQDMGDVLGSALVGGSGYDC